MPEILTERELGYYQQFDDLSSFSDESENSEDYKVGGYHLASQHDILNNRYIILKKLGFGHFSIVHLCYDKIGDKYCALKIIKSSKNYIESAQDEIKLLKHIEHAKTSGHAGYHHVIHLWNDFEFIGPHGRHLALSFEVNGPNLLHLIRRYKHKGLPTYLVKQITFQVLLGLDFMHSIHLIHTDLKPENVLIQVDMLEFCKYYSLPFPPDLNTLDKIDISSQEIDSKSSPFVFSKHYSPYKFGHPQILKVKIADLGNGCWDFHYFTNDIQTRQYRSPEIIIGSGWNANVDIWSLGCMTFELLTGDFLFDPQPGRGYTKDDDHLAQICELLGGIPLEFALSGRFANDFFTPQGKLRRIRKLMFWDLFKVLYEKYHFPVEEAKGITEFLLPMLAIDPKHRISANERVLSRWFDSIRNVSFED
eukprot:NODE_356_length_8904_cov_1.034412.p4 type:complete len:420 gc:universal NODE_356_length_8904_cov_1.034412:6596-7855(+)